MDQHTYPVEPLSPRLEATEADLERVMARWLELEARADAAR